MQDVVFADFAEFVTRRRRWSARPERRNRYKSVPTTEIYLKDLIPKTMRSQLRTDPIDQSQWVISLQGKMDWLPDQGSNLGPAD
jgi:hypothetical protein